MEFIMEFEINSPTHGIKKVLIDDEDWNKIKEQKWHIYLDKHSNHFYVSSSKRKTSMHRFIIKTPKGKQTDHINGNTLDNRKRNLRICNHAENQMNRGLNKNNTSGFKGVCWNKEGKKYIAQIKINRKIIHIGRFKTIKEAAEAYNSAAIKYHGDFAYLNKIDVE